MRQTLPPRRDALDDSPSLARGVNFAASSRGGAAAASSVHLARPHYSHVVEVEALDCDAP